MNKGEKEDRQATDRDGKRTFHHIQSSVHLNFSIMCMNDDHDGMKLEINNRKQSKRAPIFGN